MIRAIDIVLFLAILSMILSPTLGFGVLGTLKTRTFARPTRVFAEKVSWSDYKHDYIDPITQRKTASKVKDHMDPAKRAIADEYWLLQFEKDKEKLHQYMADASPTETLSTESEAWSHNTHENIDPITPHETASKAKNIMADASPIENLSSESETWSHYKHQFIDPITSHETASKVTNHMNPAKRASADEFWLRKFFDDKEKLHHRTKT